MTEHNVAAKDLGFAGEANVNFTPDILVLDESPNYYTISSGVCFHYINDIYNGMGETMELSYAGKYSNLGKVGLFGDIINSSPIVLKTVSSVESTSGGFTVILTALCNRHRQR